MAGFTLRAVGYRRVSMREQLDGFSLEAQAESIRKFASERNWKLVHIYTDAGILAKKDSERPQFLKLMNDSKDGRFDVVIVDKIDRFYRHHNGLLNALDQLNNQSEQAIENSVRALKDVTLVRAPGEGYEYSNLNYTVLGLVVQMVSGQSYVQENIFDPLEMSHSFTSLDEARRNGMSTGYLTFFGLPIAKDVPFNRGNIAGGYLISSAEDMAHYLIAQLNEGHYGNVSVISPQGMDAMHQPLVNTGIPGDSYGMGWHVSPVNDVPAIWHDGDNANFSANLMIVPRAKLGIVVLNNANGTFVAGAPNQIATGVQAILLGKQPKPYERPTAFPVLIGSTGIPALLSLVWVSWMAIAYVRHQKRPIPARRGFGWWVWVIGVPTFVDIILLVTSLVVLPKQWGMSLNTMAAQYPDCFLLLFGGAILVAVWGVVRPALTLSWARNQLQPGRDVVLHPQET